MIGQGTGEDLHQRAFTGTVAAHDAVYFAGVQSEVDVLQRGLATKRLADSQAFQERRVRGHRR